jgi:hypothetical protein
MELHFGIVEDINDPLKTGRVRVRVFSLHTQDANRLPTNKLPWAIVMQDITSAANDGVGKSPTGLQVGSHCALVFMDGEPKMKPLVLGTFAGVPVDTGTSDVPNRAKNESVTAYSGLSPIPTDPYAATYPMNHVHHTESGHYQEFDDTTDHERIKTQHKSGTFDEYHPNGDKAVYVTGSNYRLVAGSESVKINGNCTIVIGGNADITIGGNCTTNVGGTYDLTSGGAMTITAPTIDFVKG